MADWNPEKYLLFKKQRTQPAIDLAARAAGCCKPQTIADIGCGPGNSTAVLKSVFPNARILGIDSSEAMIGRAKAEHPDMTFAVCRAQELTGRYDLLFSNACLQWIPDHDVLIPALMGRLNAGGVLAVQMPRNQSEPLYRIISEVAADPAWHVEHVKAQEREVPSPEEYFDILSRCSSGFELWETTYYHVLPSHEHLVEWVRATRLRPYLEALSGPEKEAFEREILNRARQAYAATESGEVVFRFRRFFFIAHR